MNRKKQMKRLEKSRCPDKRAAASFFGGAKNDVPDNLLLNEHYFRLMLAEPPFALVVMGIRGKNQHRSEGVST